LIGGIMRIDRLDHLVLTVAEVARAIDRVL
jgi:hypothetical protein